MNAARIQFYLLTTGGQVTRLEPGKTYVCGRGDDADIIVPDSYISRHHAELHWDPDSFWSVHDLGSRNGTLVNGQRIEGSAQLLDHAKLQFGAQIYTLVMAPIGMDPKGLAPDAAALSASETLEFNQDLDQPSASISGTTDRQGLPDLIQFFILTRRSGRLHLHGINAKNVWFLSGVPIAAECGPTQGKTALLDLCHEETDGFEFYKDEDPPNDEAAAITGSAESILMDLALSQDHDARSDSPPAALVPEEAPAPAANQNQPSSHESTKAKNKHTTAAIKQTNANKGPNDSVTLLPFGMQLEGKQFGQVRLRTLIGEGHCAQVYRAHHELLDKDVAVKVLLPRGNLKDEQNRKRLLREARIASKIQHHNVVTVQDALVDEDGTIALVLDLVEGPNLGQLLEERGTLPSSEVMRYAPGIAAGIQAIHRQAAVHRDIKPDNILISPDGTPKISDLGMARHLDDQTIERLTATGVCVGTPLYMAPESIEDQSSPGAAVDIYAFGITLYHLISGQAPFAGDTAVEVMRAHMQGKYTPLDKLVPGMDKALCKLIHRCMHKQVDKRPDIDLLVSSLEQIAGRSAQSGRPLSHDGGPAHLRTTRAFDSTQRNANPVIKTAVVSVIAILLIAIICVAMLSDGQ